MEQILLRAKFPFRVQPDAESVDGRNNNDPDLHVGQLRLNEERKVRIEDRLFVRDKKFLLLWNFLTKIAHKHT